MRADDSRLLGIPRSRPIITMIYPHHGGVLQDCPALSGEVSFSPLTDLRITTLSLHQCSARVARDIKGHHRPVIAWRLQQVTPASQCKRGAIPLALALTRAPHLPLPDLVR
jgi:hypothetical protein